jgi:hypothetical protein
MVSFKRLALAVMIMATTPVAASASNEIAFLREDCGSLSPCYTTSSALLSWLWGTRNPTANDPVTVDIGPGTFGPLSCQDDGHVTFRGAGRSHTVIESTGSTPAVSLDDCDGVDFQDLKVKGNEIAFDWLGAGKTTITDVHVVAGGSTTRSYGWIDNTCGAGAEIYWYGVRMDVEATAPTTWGDLNSGLYAFCAEHWVFGSEITVSGSANTPSQARILSVYVPGGDVRLFGSVVRAQSAGATSTTWVGQTITGGAALFPGFAGVWVGANGNAHVHGGLIRADASTSTGNQNAYGVYTFQATGFLTGFAHVVETAFVVSASGSGTATRLNSVGTSVIESPYQWPAGAAPPAIASAHGADQFVETDCDGSGDCDAAGTETHLMIYNTSCTADGPWFDVVTGVCRGTTP